MKMKFVRLSLELMMCTWDKRKREIMTHKGDGINDKRTPKCFQSYYLLPEWLSIVIKSL